MNRAQILADLHTLDELLNVLQKATHLHWFEQEPYFRQIKYLLTRIRQVTEQQNQRNPCCSDNIEMIWRSVTTVFGERTLSGCKRCGALFLEQHPLG